jgi:energy-coupling factor transporter ATP-binding protein EcfA2
LGIGVNPEFTGRENILYGGMLLGMSKGEVLRKTPSIIEFAELGEYIDYPFRTYSSGMKSRLMFAIAMSVDPDILIVDEVLSTGDAAFVAKSANRIKQICYSGATILFVSHNLKHVEELCPRCIVMNQGAIFFEGDTRQAVSKYIESNYKNKQGKIALMNTHDKEPKPYQGTGEIRVEDIYCLVDGERTETLTIGKACQICIDIEALRNLDQVTLCVELFSEKSPIAYAFLLDYRGFVGSMPESFRIKAGKTRFVITLSELIVGDGLYWGNVEFYPGSKDYRFSYDTCYCYYKRIFAFQAVLSDEKWFGRGTLTEIPVKSVEMRER